MLKGYDKSIKAEGQVYYSPSLGKITTNLNYSDIFSELIQAAGMGCEYYASDLFYDLVAIRDAVENLESRVFFIGIRSSGVDGNNFIKSRLKDNPYTYEYIKLYRLELITTDNRQTLEIKRADRYDVRNELCKEENV